MKKEKKLRKLLYNLGELQGAFNAGLKSSWSNPSPSDNAAWLGGDSWGPGITQGGKPVTISSYLEYFTSWSYIAASKNAEAISAVPLRTYVKKATKGQKFKTVNTLSVNKSVLRELNTRAHLVPFVKDAMGGIEEVVDHPLVTLLDFVNKFSNRQELWELTSVNLDITGNAYWYLIKDGLRVPRAIWVVSPQFLKPIPGTSLDDFITGYEYQRGNQQVTIPIEDMVHFKFPNPKSQYIGYSCIAGVTDAVYTNSKMYEFEEAIFENKASLGSIIEASDTISTPEVERLQLELRQKKQGTANAGSNLILPPGLKVIKDKMTPTELSFIEGKKLTREEICAGLDCPIAMLVSTDVNRANADAAIYTHAKNGVLPRLTKLEAAINKFIVPLFDDSGKLFVAFDNPVPTDKAFEQQKQKEYVDIGVLSIDEARESEGKEPLPGGVGEIPYIDSRKIPVGQAPVMPQSLSPTKSVVVDEGQIEDFSKKVVEKINIILG